MGVLSLLSYYIILIHQERFMLLEYIRYSKFIDSFICGKVYFIIVFFVIIVIVISDTDSSISILSGKHRHVFILYLHQQILYLGKDVHVFLFSRLYSVARGKHRMMHCLWGTTRKWNSLHIWWKCKLPLYDRHPR